MVSAGTPNSQWDCPLPNYTPAFAFSNTSGVRKGGRGLPVDAGWTYERVVSASGGRVPDIHRIRARLRVYLGLW